MSIPDGIGVRWKNRDDGDAESELLGGHKAFG